MSRIKQILHVLGRSLGMTLLTLVFLLVAFSTQSASFQDLAGADYPENGEFSAVDIVQAAAYLPARVERYFNNHFIGRDRLVHANYWVRLNVLGERDFHDVVVGNEGWLFYSGERNLDYYQNANLMSPAQITALMAQLSETREILAAQGIPFYIVVAPNKESIYPEYLPAEIRREGETSLLDRMLRDRRDQDLNLIDLRPALLEAKEQTQVYYRTDTHWNPEGALAAYQDIAKRLQADIPELKPFASQDFRKIEETISGDLSFMLTMKDDLKEQALELEPAFERQAVTEFAGDGSFRISVCDDPGLPTAMIFHDSFYNGLMPFVGEHFRQAILVNSFHVDLDWAAREKPDVVILEVAERYLPELLQVEE